MPYTPIDPSRYNGDLIVDETFFEDMVKNDEFLFGQLGALPPTIQNGEFEVDSDGDGQPDNITINRYAGGQVMLDTTQSAEGFQCLKIIHPGGVGAGGGSAEFDYIPCSDLKRVLIGFIHWATAAGMHNLVKVRFFDREKLEIAGSSISIYDSTNNPTAAQYFIAAFLAPTGARYFKLSLIGGYNDTNVAGTAYFDGVSLAGFELFHNYPANFTIGAASSSNSSYSDVASATVHVSLLGMPINLSFTALQHSEVGDYQTFMRFRIGSVYSNEVSETSSTDVAKQINLLFTPTAAQNIVTIYMQLKGLGHGAYGSKPTATATVFPDLTAV